MNVHPNQTLVTATVTQVKPCADGYGFDVDLEIGENKSSDAKADFLRPKSGDRLQVFAASQGDLSPGQKIQATLGLAAGPFGERTILRKSEPAKS